MPNKKMSVDERYKYLEIQYERYREANEGEKRRLLDEMMVVTGMHRKSLIRLMKHRPRRCRRKRQRSKIYGPQVQDIVRTVARALDYPCRERLQPMLGYMAAHLESLGKLEISEESREQLGSISISTVGRILKRIQQDEPRLRRRTAGASVNKIQKQVPIRMIPWDECAPGHFEVDLVHHSGPSASGEFVCSLQMVDVATGWSEIVAILGRSYLVTQNGFEHCLARMPFNATEIHSDNGSEFLNSHLLTFWQNKYKGITLSRTRPYHSQENRFVEHRNGALIRAMIGHDRFDTVNHTKQLNRVYEKIWLYFNFFQPVMRLTEKIHTDGKVHRKHDDVRTPFQRLCASGILAPEKRQELVSHFKQTDPFTLREEIDRELAILDRLPNANAGQTEDVYHTLQHQVTN